MFFKINKRLTGVIFLDLVILSNKPAWAYLDPGSGSYLIQVIIAGIVTGGVLLTTMREKIKTFLAGWIKKVKKDRS